MSYIKNLDVDVEVRETVGKIASVVARHFPESEYEDGNWEVEIAYLVRGLVNTTLKHIWDIERRTADGNTANVSRDRGRPQPH